MQTFFRKNIIPILIIILVVLAGNYIWIFSQGRKASEENAKPEKVIAGDMEKIQAQGFDPVKFGLPAGAKEVVTERTSRTVTFEISPGKFAAVSYDGKAYARDADGNVVPVEEKGEVKGQEFVFERLPNNIKVRFDLTRPSYIIVKDNYWMRVTFNAPATGEVTGTSTIMYRLAPNVRLEWKVVGANVEKSIYIEKEGSLPDLSFKIENSDNLIQKLEKNVVNLYSGNKLIEFRTREPFIMDSKGVRSDKKVSLIKNKKGSYDYSYDKSGLEFPYIIDPTAGPISAGSGDTYSGTSWTNPSYITVEDGTSVATNGPFIGGTPAENSIKLLVNGAPAGDNKSTATNLTTSLANYNYGASDSLWGLSLSPAIVNSSSYVKDSSGFGLTVQYRIDPSYSGILVASGFVFNIDSGATIDGVSAVVKAKYSMAGMPPRTTLSVDFISMTVYYTAGISGPLSGTVMMMGIPF